MEILSLDIPPNNIGGTMPASIGENMPLLQVFTLASQSLIGTIPESIGKCTKMTIFHMGGNHFTNIPSSIGNLGPMQSFAIEDNNMHNVTLPNKGPTFEKGVLGACDLSGNVFACPIPEWARDDFCQASCH